MSLPEWLLLVSSLLALAVLRAVLAGRVRLPVAVVLAVVGFLAAWIGGFLGGENPLRGEEFEEAVVFFLPVLIFEAVLGLNTRAFVEGAKEIFAGWEREAVASLQELDSGVGKDHRELGRRQAEALSRVASQDALEELVEIGLLPEVVAQRAAEAVAAQVGGRSDEGP